MIPFQHQKEAFERFKDKPYGALFLEMGLGKTKVAIDIADYHFKRGEITAALVLTKKSLIGNWTKIEIPKHSTCAGLILPWKQKAVDFGDFSKQNLTYFVANIEALLTIKFEATFKNFIKHHPKFMLIIDESTTIKTRSAERTKRAKKLSQYAAYRFILSGMPVTNSPLDLWSQAEILHDSLLGFNYFTFKCEYAIMEKKIFGMRTFEEVVGYRNLDKLTREVNKFAIIKKVKDCLDLPDVVYKKIPCDLTTEQKKAYRDMKEKSIVEIRDTSIISLNAVSVINRLLQICAGQLTTPDGEYIYLENQRIELTNDLIEESDEKSIIWCYFNGVGNALFKNIETSMYLENTTSIETFESNPDIKAIIASQSKDAFGHTILKGRNVIYFSQSFSVEQRAQSEKRSHRVGQTQKVVYTDIYAPGTIEEKVQRILTTNIELADQIIKDRSKLLELIEYA